MQDSGPRGNVLVLAERLECGKSHGLEPPPALALRTPPGGHPLSLIPRKYTHIQAGPSKPWTSRKDPTPD